MYFYITPEPANKELIPPSKKNLISLQHPLPVAQAVSLPMTAFMHHTCLCLYSPASLAVPEAPLCLCQCVCICLSCIAGPARVSACLCLCLYISLCPCMRLCLWLPASFNLPVAQRAATHVPVPISICIAYHAGGPACAYACSYDCAHACVCL